MMSSNGVLPHLQQDLQKTKVTKWTCDVCQVAAFDTFEEASEHEKNCRGFVGAQAPHGRALGAANTCIPANNNNTDPSSVYQQQQYYAHHNQLNGQIIPPQNAHPSAYQQQPPPQNYFYPQQPPPHQQQGGSTQYFHNSSALQQQSISQIQTSNKPQVPPQQQEVEQKKQQTSTTNHTFKTIWTCDVCKVAEFESFEKAVEHEKTCKGIPPSYQPKKSTPPPPEPQKQASALATAQESCHNQEDKRKNNETSSRDDQQKNQNNDKIPQVQDENQQAAKKRCFVCDICRVAIFQTFEEAFEHEKTCKGLPTSGTKSSPKRPPDTTEKSPPLQTQNHLSENPPVAVSRSKEERHKNDNGTPTTSSPTTTSTTRKDHQEKKSPSRNTNKKKSTNHNRQEQKNSLPSSSDPTSKTSKIQSNGSGRARNPDVDKDRNNIASSTSTSTSSSSNNNHVTQSQQIPLSKSKSGSEEKSSGDKVIEGKNMSRSNSSASISNSTQTTTKTKKVSFNEEGSRESTNGGSDEKQKVSLDSECPNSTDELAKLSEEQQESYHAVLSPLLRNDADSPDYFKLSSFHVCLMSSIDLFEEDASFPCQKSEEEQKGEQSYVSFRCTYCKEKVLPSAKKPSFWTIDLVASKLCPLFYDHLSTNCEDVPVKKMQRLEAFVAHKKSGKITFNAFIKKFCADNGILDVKSNDPRGTIPSHMKLLKPPKKWDGAHSCRRRAEVLAFAEKSNTFPMSRLRHDDAFPQPEGSLSIFNQTALEQVCFMIPNTAEKQRVHKQIHRVAIQCKHCGNYNHLNSLESWYKVMYTMTYSHLIKTCQSIPKDIRLKLITQQGKKKQPGNGKTAGLKQYCDFLARYYKFEDLKSPNGVGVRVIPVEQEIEGNPKKRKLVESQEQVNSDTNKKAELLNSSTSAKSQSTEKGILIEGENGCSAFLTPSNGVPLHSSLTATMASELNVHNKLLVNHFELCEKGEPLPSGLSPLCLRCQNCNFCPSKSFTKALTSVSDFFKILGKCGNHLETCKSTPKQIREEAKKTKSTNSIGCITLKEYCGFIADVYGLTDVSKGHSGGQVVTWSENYKYMLSEYSSTPGVLVKCKKGNIQNGERTSKKNKSSGTDRPRIVLSDYDYFILGQIELVSIPNLSDKTADDVKVGVRCKHCASTKPMSSIENFVCNRLHQFYAHLKCCPEVSKDFIERMDDLKSKDEEQRSCTDSVSTVEEAALVVLEDIFQLENSKSQGVILNSQNIGGWNLIQKLGSSQENFNLMTSEMSLLTVSKVFFPILLKEVMIPVSKC